ncbi:hypothetical protein [Halofilum ochraceum]|uniref:hypothetical protein n=1 Tax=Halofilum ochraceum TaxID=1611323 RepID=UPI0008D9090A|nr:hypothetical protein [Halofilum ochraceum]
MAFLYYLKEFQTLVAGAVGFAGVIATLAHNASVSRNQRAEERAHERNTLRAALLAELKINRDAIRENLDRVKEGAYDKAAGVLVPTDSIDDVYRAFLPQIGLLPEDDASKVMTAYLSMEAHIARLYLIGSVSGEVSQYVKLTGESISMARDMQERLLEPLGLAIDALQASSAQNTGTRK